MARTREFNKDDALDKAMQLFWKKGYAETSVRDLVDFTGVAHAGLYSAFGGKKELFQAALDHYNQIFGNRLFGPIEQADSGVREIEEFFEIILNAVKQDRFKNGCFMCNTAVEFGNDAVDVLSLAQRNIDRLTAAIEAALTRAKANKQVKPDLHPKATANFLASVFYGVSVLSRSKTDVERIEDTISIALKTLR